MVLRENLYTLVNTTVNGEYIFSGSDTTKKSFSKDSSFDINGKVEFDGDAILRTVAVEPATYRERGISAFDVIMYNADTAGAGEELDFIQSERIIDENNLEWNLNKATVGNKLTFDSSETIMDDDGVVWALDTSTLKLVNANDANVSIDVKLVEGNKYQTVAISSSHTQDDGTTALGYLAVDDDSSGTIDASDLKIRAFDNSGELVGSSAEMSVVETSGTPNTYKAEAVTSGTSRFLEAKHNYFDDLNIMINALNGYETNIDGTKGTITTDLQRDTLLREALGNTSKQYDGSNVGHAELAGRNHIFDVSAERISAKTVHYNILLQEVSGADLSKLAMESKSLEMTYQALYSTVSKMHELSLLNFIK